MVIVTNVTYVRESAQRSLKMEDSRSLFSSLNASSIVISISLRKNLASVDITFEIYFISKFLAEQAIASDLTQSHLSHQLEGAGMGPITVVGPPSIMISVADGPSPAQSTDSTPLVVIIALSVGLPAAILALGIQIFICRRYSFCCFGRKAVNTDPAGANSP